MDSMAPIPGATLSLTYLKAEDIEWEIAWHEDDWGTLDRSTVWATSNAAGRFAFDLSDEATHGAVVWVTHSGHMAGHVVLGPDSNSWPRDLRIVLHSAALMTVLVQDVNGIPAPRATVEQFGLTPDSAGRGSGTLSELRARRLLSREVVTGADGIALLDALPGEQMLVASRGGELSTPWRGPARERVVLTLVPSFEVAGDVVLPDWDHTKYEGERRITIAVQQKNLWRSLHTIRSVASGPWGPVSLPILDVERYRIRLEGAPIIPSEAFFAPPAPGARLDRDLVAELGIRMCLRVTDEDTNVLQEAVAKVYWQVPNDTERWNFIERGPLPPGNSNEGTIEAWSVPRGTVIVEASAPGHVTVRSGLVSAEAYENVSIPIILKRASRVTGRCLHKGKPVSDFEVLTWRTSDRSYTSKRFFDRQDGTFELDTAPEGDCWITACSGSLPGCEPRQIRTTAGGTTDVVLELPDALRGFGQVVDEETGEAIPNAYVQLFVPGDLLGIARWGDPIPAGPDGVFEIDGFREGKNELSVLAKGYSRILLTRSMVGDLLDWGTIKLSRSHTLTVVLEDTTGKNEFDGMVIAGKGDQVLPPQKIASDGTAQFTDVGAGTYAFVIEEPDGTTTSIVSTLSPGRDWDFRHRIAGLNQLTVEALVADSADLAGGLGIAVTWSSPLGYNVMRTVGPITDTKNAFEIDGIDSETVQAFVYDSLQVTRAIASGQFSGGRLHLTLPLASKFVVFEVVDGDANPVADVRIVASDPRQPGLHLMGSTNSQGLCELTGLSFGEAVVSLRHGSMGSQLGIPVDASSGRVKLVLDARARIELVVQDGDTRLEGVSCSLLDAGNPAILGGLTDADGRLTIRDLGEGDYLLDASKSDCWPVQVEARARATPGLLCVQVRRVGDLDLQIVAAGGLPVSGLPVELTSLEFGTSVSTWIEEKRVSASGLVTDLSGRIRVEGLPNGSYGWRLNRPEGEALEGDLVVRPRPETAVRLTLPE